jgi:hypothetical protein
MSNIYRFHGLRRMKAMGKTARGFRPRAPVALRGKHPAILPWRSFHPSVVRQLCRRE